MISISNKTIVEVSTVSEPDQDLSRVNQLSAAQSDALSDTVAAMNPFAQSYAEIYGADEWNGLSEEERAETIESEYAEEIESAREEEEESAAIDHEFDEKSAVKAAIEACFSRMREKAEGLGFSLDDIEFKLNASGDSGYFTITRTDDGAELTVRVSDHEQPRNGSYLVSRDGEGARRASDVSVVLASGRFDLSAAFSAIEAF